MKNHFKKFKYIILLFIYTLILLIIIKNANIVKNSAKAGMILCADVIIPALFPFLVFTLVLYKSGILYKIPLPKKLERIKGYLIIFILSNLGGYPVGARIISEEYENGILNSKNSQLILNCAVNCGPAFSILAVGVGILGSLNKGIIIYISQIISSFIIFLICIKKIEQNSSKTKRNEYSFTENFVDSVTNSSIAMLNICGYIVVFSVILEIINQQNIAPIINFTLSRILEISNAVMIEKNIYALSAILGFGTFSIIFQVLFICKSFSPNPLKLIFCKIFQGILSLFLTFVLLKLFPISEETLSNFQGVITINQNNSIILSLLLILTAITFLFSISTKRFCGKISNDIFLN